MTMAFRTERDSMPPCAPTAGFMNSTSPLKRSIVMDLVPRSERGFWNGAQVIGSSGRWAPHRWQSLLRMQSILSKHRHATVASCQAPDSIVNVMPQYATLPCHAGHCILEVRSLAACAGLADVWTFNWCGSAVLGGYLLDWYGFRVSFALTAMLQALAWSLMLLLLPVVPAQEGAAAAARAAQPAAQSSAAAEAVVVATEPELAEPLLAADN